MKNLEKLFGINIFPRTWNIVNKIVEKNHLVARENKPNLEINPDNDDHLKTQASLNLDKEVDIKGTQPIPQELTHLSKGIDDQRNNKISQDDNSVQSITPFLTVFNVQSLINFIQLAFKGALIVKYEANNRNILYAEMRIGESLLLMGIPGKNSYPINACIHLFSRP